VTVEIRRGADRGRTRTPWLDSRHGFSYGSYYDPDNLGFGALSAVNEDRLAAGRGFDLHRHSDVEIVTWVLDGVLVHSDDSGHRELLSAGMAQHLGAGSGARHSEHASADGPAHYVQMWLRPTVSGLGTVYVAHDFSTALAAGGWVTIASGLPERAAPLRPRQLDAELRAVRLPAEQSTTVAAADLGHLQVTRGQIALAEDMLAAGDAARLTDAGPLSVTADGPAELLLWAFYP
jgi:redox-sensitive bicupin YhaK (pirin superfamily)